MRVLFDTNVLLDALLHRDTAHLYSSALLVMVANQYIDAYVAPHSLSNIYYILRKDKNEEERKQIISKILLYTKVVPIDAGTYHVKAVIAPNVSYEGTEVVKEFTIGKATLTITAPKSSPTPSSW